MGEQSPIFYLRPPGHVRAPGNFIITHHPPICQEKNAKKIKKIIFPKHLTNRPKCVILLVSRGEVASEFGADKPVSAWAMGPLSLWVAQKNVKNPLTNHFICDIIQIQSGGKSPLSALVRLREERDPRESHKTY